LNAYNKYLPKNFFFYMDIYRILPKPFHLRNQKPKENRSLGYVFEKYIQSEISKLIG